MSALRVSIPSEQAEVIRSIAKEQKKTSSEIVRHAIKSYTFHQNWRKSLPVRKKIADKLGIYSDRDVLKQFGL